MIPVWLDEQQSDQPFPDASLALTEPNGLLAIGGDLSPSRLLSAYRQGIFPWYSDGEPVMWWSPEPRAVLYPDQVIISRSLARTLKKHTLVVTFDQAFPDVVRACAAARPGSPGTWITGEMYQAYCRMHELGHAHSIEAWHGSSLVGGLYGLAIGCVFFGESMFHRERDASKIAFINLVDLLISWRYKLIDCQLPNRHLSSLGATLVPRQKFTALLNEFCQQPPHELSWTMRPSSE